MLRQIDKRFSTRQRYNCENLHKVLLLYKKQYIYIFSYKFGLR